MQITRDLRNNNIGIILRAVLDYSSVWQVRIVMHALGDQMDGDATHHIVVQGA